MAVVRLSKKCARLQLSPSGDGGTWGEEKQIGEWVCVAFMVG